MIRWVALLLPLLIASCGGRIVPAAPPPEPVVSAPAPPEFPPPEPVPSGSPAPSWRGGSVEQLPISPLHLVPDAGFGLYVYELPGSAVTQGVLTALEDFNCRALLAAHPGPAQPAVAVMLLPLGNGHVDTALSSALLTAMLGPSVSQRNVYFVFSAKPVFNPLQPVPPGHGLFAIYIPGTVAAPYVESWMTELVQKLEQGQVSSPSAAMLQLRSLAYTVGNVATLVSWIQPAQAEPAAPSCVKPGSTPLG